jgi:hypothetical protein
MNNKAIEAYNAAIIKQEREAIQALLSANNLHYDFDVDYEGFINITIEDGDWKDHIFLKNLMSKNGYVYFGYKEIGEDTGGDWYSAIHKFR